MTSKDKCLVDGMFTNSPSFYTIRILVYGGHSGGSRSFFTCLASIAHISINNKINYKELVSIHCVIMFEKQVLKV